MNDAFGVVARRHCQPRWRNAIVPLFTFSLLAPGLSAIGEETASRFVLGLNLNGPSVEIDGRRWEGKDSKRYETKDSAFENQGVPLRPATDAARALMIRSSRWSRAVRIGLTGMPAGRCTVFVYVWEDNDPETITLALQGNDVVTDFRTGEAGEWRRLGPFVVEVKEDGAVVLTSRGGAANISGIEVWEGVGKIPEPLRAADGSGGPAAVPDPLPAVPAEVAARFNGTIAPLFARHCLECHNGSDARGGLDLSHWKQAGRGGESGAAFVAGKPEESLAWQYVESGEMPKDRPPLLKEEKAALRAWIADGAVWGAARVDPFLVSTDRRAGYDFWSLRPVRSPPVPDHSHRADVRNEIDAFVLERLGRVGEAPLSASPRRSVGLSPLYVAGEADRRTLIRRVTFDLIGLPPSPEEVDAFVASDDPRAYEALVDRLLASPQHAERWARHWLDVVRFGESQGYERNKVRENAWRYRDWVIDVFHQNMPYDEFVRRQIAGDVLHPDDLDSLIATGYHVIGAWDQVAHFEGSQEMRKAARQDDLEDLAGTLGQAFLGLTVNCARCHDHKFDPIPQADYYRIVSLLSGVTQKVDERTKIELKPRDDRPATRNFDGTAHVASFQPPATTFVLARGDYRKPGEVVTPAGLTALDRAGLPADFGLSPDASDADRRKRLAEWLTDRRNPLTARVFVNRVWYYHFGEGIVDTPSDFGYSGGRPSHPELLDYLSARFMNDGWNVRNLHRLMVTSAAYRRASRVRNEAAESMDGDNRLLWRGNRHRLEGEAVRDAILFVSGALNPQVGGKSFRDVHIKVTMNHEFTTPTDEFSPETCRRSIYRLWARSGGNRMLESFDCPDPTVMSPRRTRTTTPLQALSLFNNRFVEACAGKFAERIEREAGEGIDGRIDRAYRLAFGRLPSATERALANDFVREFGLTQFCLTLFNTNEFVHVE